MLVLEDKVTPRSIIKRLPLEPLLLATSPPLVPNPGPRNIKNFVATSGSSDTKVCILPSKEKPLIKHTYIAQ